ncbi:unnamed protein product [Chilo suppressalis]|uniref:CRAL-TRIO domain-containing protein n=1 Tax=Chilo suppressalis TaxID=168631 RepID=A0ABN8BEJ4_CHISP|nr:unnamed protein product [Chilo suppressalis]
MAMDTMAVELPELPAHAPSTPLEETPEEKYERLLRRARTEDLSEVSGIGCLYQSGVDRLGRPVVIFIGKWFPIGDVDLDKRDRASAVCTSGVDRLGRPVVIFIGKWFPIGDVDLDKALLYLILLLDPIVRGDYVIAYFHTLAYKKNLKAFYIVHPTFWTKVTIKAKVHSLPGVEYLYSVMPRDQLELPAFVTEYDMTVMYTLPYCKVLYCTSLCSIVTRHQLELPAFVTEYDMTINGLHYFQPDTNNT